MWLEHGAADYKVNYLSENFLFNPDEKNKGLQQKRPNLSL